VHLNRQGNPSERGLFRCEVANAAGDMVTVYVNIGEWFAFNMHELCDATALCFIPF
jgi:hypothetical protein